MRHLNMEFAQRGRFYSSEDLRAIIHQLAPDFRELRAFWDDYVAGTRELEYDKYLAYAGLRLVTEGYQSASLGFTAAYGFEGPVRVVEVEAGSTADEAGLKVGDVIAKINGETLSAAPTSTVCSNPANECNWRWSVAPIPLASYFRWGHTPRRIIESRKFPIPVTSNSASVAAGWKRKTSGKGSEKR